MTCGPPGSGEAVATVVSDGLADQVALFGADEAGWVVLDRRPVDAVPSTFVPPDFSLSLYRSWRDKYDLRQQPGPPPTAGRRPPGTSDPAAQPAVCRGQNGTIVCKNPNPTTTTVPTSTSTRVPTTTAVPAPATTAPPSSAPKPPSAFCLSHPLDARCGLDPSFPG